MRAYCILENLTMEAIIYSILDIGQRNRWDKNFFGFRLVEAPPGGCQIMTSTFKSPAPFVVQHRDFVQYRRVSMKRDERGDPIYMILFRSAEHPDAPERKGVVRAETYISGYILRKNKEDRKKLDFFLVSLADPRGLIPKWLVNRGSATAPPQWIAALTRSCLEVMKDQAQMGFAVLFQLFSKKRLHSFIQNIF